MITRATLEKIKTSFLPMKLTKMIEINLSLAAETWKVYGCCVGGDFRLMRP